MTRRALHSVSLLLVLLTLAPLAAAGNAALQARLDPVVAPVSERAFVGVLVVSATQGDVLYATNADRPFVPASNAKLITSATALATLGPDYRFVTRALATGPVRAGGVLEGDLWLRGGGDPVLMEKDLSALARRVRAAGVTRVRGRLLADDTRFDDRRLGWGWEADDESAYYAAQVSALSVNRNVVKVTVRPGGHVGAPPRVYVAPLQSYMRAENRATTGPLGKADLQIDRARGKNTLVLRGSLPLRGAGRTGVEVTVEDPTRFTALLFRKALAGAGVTVGGKTVRGAAPVAARVVAAHWSPPLSEVVQQLNKPSDNLIAEMLLKAIAAEKSGKGTSRGGAAEVEAFLKRVGADTERLLPRDGSGLSRHNLVTPRALVQLLGYVREQPFYSVFKTSLPVAGVDGTLKNRLRDCAACGNCWAKTGTLSNVSALSGYVRAANGEELVFSIMTNNYPGTTSRTGPVKRMEDGIVTELAEFRR